jgi:hypothetical protein
MAHEISIPPEGGFVLVQVSGTLTADEVGRMVTAARAMSDSATLPILYDMSAATPGSVSRSDLFWMPRNMPALKSPWARRVRVGLVHPAEHGEDALFWETSFRNLGLDVKAFTSREEAVAWLR